MDLSSSSVLLVLSLCRLLLLVYIASYWYYFWECADPLSSRPHAEPNTESQAVTLKEVHLQGHVLQPRGTRCGVGDRSMTRIIAPPGIIGKGYSMTAVYPTWQAKKLSTMPVSSSLAG
ncbi:hypothetical protein EI94DRAFT_1304810 [Lactarius quietus]|nr:hypothetical protein EI94DRAFT_1304810 [Lactarius quietus]